jgi:hypothetical protein
MGDRCEAAQRRFRRQVWIAITVLSIGWAIAIGAGYRENGQRIDDLCRAQDAQNAGIVGYLKGLGATDAQIKQAREFFPERNCSGV